MLPLSMPGEYVLLVKCKGDTAFQVALDGPWDTEDEARVFAEAECGAQWMVAKIMDIGGLPTVPNRD